ncbi:MAG: ATP-dependent DNA ligase [Candidatus ainarchaeum sp.]|nr:ATP-dependent DNA ligase [Candidatus ainarchaeum sp.]MDD3975958.1 ATP-dependent DNA ligase [Candidatus ainarchaeum sp.]
MKFKEICLYFEKIEKTSSRLEIASILKEIFLKVNSEELSKLVYFLQGTIGPIYKGKEINIGPKTLINLIAKYLGQTTVAVKKELNKKGDLGIVITSLESKVFQKTLFSKELEFLDVYLALEKISNIDGKNAIFKKLQIFESILFNLDKISAKYIIRFPISFRLGFGDSTIIDALSFLDDSIDQKKSREIISIKYEIISDLGYLSKIIKEKGILFLENLSLEKFVPFKSALCERAKNFSEIVKRLSGPENKEFIVDSKIDGFRQQIHKFGQVIKIFSRNQEEMSNMFPDIVEEIKKINFDFIIDCEAIAYDYINNRYLPFQITMQRKRKYDIFEKSKKLPLHLKVFDIIYFKDKETFSLSNLERRKIIEKYFNISEIIKPTEIIITKNVKELEDFFNNRIENGFEGIIAKDLDSSYKAGSRGFNWIKFKKSYYNNSLDTIDAVILGVFLGQGKRSENKVGALLMGIYDSFDEKYKTIAKLGSGLSDDILKYLCNIFEKDKLSYKPINICTNIEPDYYVLPKIIVEINFDDITFSNLHTCCYSNIKKTGLALRFPRFIKFRTDKTCFQTTTSEEINRIFDLQNN